MKTRRQFPTLRTTWPERWLWNHHNPNNPFLERAVPSWDVLVQEEQQMRAAIHLGMRPPWPGELREKMLQPQWWDNGSPDFNIHYPQSFLGLPSVQRYMGGVMKWWTEIGQQLSPGKMGEMTVWDIFFVELYGTYSVRRWEHFGRRAYLIDPDTFELFANTTLPRNMPASELRAPFPSFWIAFPEGAYVFDTGLDAQSNPQMVDGVLVNITEPEPASGHPRLLTMIAGGRSMRSAADDHMVFFNEPLDERPITELFGGNTADEDLRQGGQEIGVLTPRAVMNFLLYLMSEQPLVEPVPPTPRRSFAEIRSPKQREAALRNQEQKLKGVSQLGYLYVGRPFTAEERAQRPEGRDDDRRRWKLDHEVWVQGHYKFQAHGPKHSLRKLIYVQPYRKGRGIAEKVTDRVQGFRVQPARRSGEVA